MIPKDMAQILSEEYEIKILEKMRFGIVRLITKQVVEDFGIDVCVERFFKDIKVKITAAVYKKDDDIVEFKWYSSWWQELREKILPKWYIKKYPSKLEIKKKVKVISKYPTIKIHEEKHKAHLEILTIKDLPYVEE